MSETRRAPSPEARRRFLAGLAAASRLAGQLAGASITVVDGRQQHWYQPGFTLVASGIKPMDYVVSQTADYIPKGVTWVAEALAEIDPEARKVVTASGRTLPYDFLIVATGLELAYDAIEGMDTARIGQDGLGSICHSPQGAAATWQAMSRFADTGGVGVFGRPTGEMKCAGAPLKYTFITDDHLRRRGQRGKAELLYHAHGKVLFSVPIVAEKVRMLFQDRGVTVRQEHVLEAIDPGRRIATFQTPAGPVEQRYDFINVVPPMRAPRVVNNLVMSFPGVIAPLEELWISWVMKTIALKPTYVAMLRGRA